MWCVTHNIILRVQISRALLCGVLPCCAERFFLPFFPFLSLLTIVFRKHNITFCAIVNIIIIVVRMRCECVCVCARMPFSLNWCIRFHKVFICQISRSEKNTHKAKINKNENNKKTEISLIPVVRTD